MLRVCWSNSLPASDPNVDDWATTSVGARAGPTAPVACRRAEREGDGEVRLISRRRLGVDNRGGPSSSVGSSSGRSAFVKKTVGGGRPVDGFAMSTAVTQ